MRYRFRKKIWIYLVLLCLAMYLWSIKLHYVLGTERKNHRKSKSCQYPAVGLRGYEKLSVKVLPLEKLSSKYNYVKNGHFNPYHCTAVQKVAIIVPYRNREMQLKIFLNNIIPKLYRQHLDFTIYVIELESGSRFNRGILNNIGFHEASTDSQYDCYIFHDVDILTEDDRNYFLCGKNPRHLTGLMKLTGEPTYRILNGTNINGVMAFTKEQFKLINGYSNQFFERGIENKDLSCRLQQSHLQVERPNLNVSHARSYSGIRNHVDKKSLDILNSVAGIYKNEGLSNLRYQTVDKDDKPLYKWILVQINRTDIEQERINLISKSGNLKNDFEKSNPCHYDTTNSKYRR